MHHWDIYMYLSPDFLYCLIKDCVYTYYLHLLFITCLLDLSSQRIIIPATPILACPRHLALGLFLTTLDLYVQILELGPWWTSC